MCICRIVPLASPPSPLLRGSPSMSDVLQPRRALPPNGAPRKANGHASQHKCSSTGASPQQKTARTVTTLPKVLAGSVLLALISWVYYKKVDTAAPLPDSYVLCSRHGPAIYTVNAENLKVDCLAVHQSRVVHTGTLGTPIDL